MTENDVDVNDPCDLEDEPSRAENSYHVVRAFMLEDPVVLEQVTITGGNADGDPPSDRYKGGGLLCESSRNLQVLNCTFRENFADTGGGMFNYNSDPEVTSCSFIGNAAARAGGLGGGMAGAYHSNPTVSNCTFSGNYSARGGAVNHSGGEAMFSSCDFTRNLAGSGGAGYINYGTILFEQCKFSMNSASVGGALATGPIHCDLAHCVLAANSAALSGGAIYMQATDDLTVTNCTFSDNAAPQGRAFSLEFRASILRVASSILWDAGQEISNANNSPVSVTYTNLFGGWPGVGNIDADPLFADPSGGDYHLKSKAGRWHASSNSWILDDATSPCIDAGDPSAPIGLEPFPNAGRINMGAYGGTAEASKSYFGAPVCGTIVAGDINGDCRVDFVDLQIMALHWLEKR